MDRVFQKLIDSNFSDLKGTVLNASIPVPQGLINELIEASLRGNQRIASCTLSIQPENRVTVHLKTTMLPWPLNLKLKLDKAVDFASFASPKIRAWLENHRFLGRMGSTFNALPEGIKIYGTQVVLDLGVFLQTPEQKRLLELVKSADIQTEEGKVILDVRAEVD